MLTETRFKEFYEEAERLRALGGSAAAGELLLFLFDNGRNVGGYGVVRLSFVLRDLAALADLSSPRPEPDAQRVRRALERRRDERERLASSGDASFTDLQELVALNRALNDSKRSLDLYNSLAAGALGSQGSDEIPSDELAQARRTLGELLAESAFPADAERIAVLYENEQIKRKLVELEREMEEQLASPAAAIEMGQLAALVNELRSLCGRYRAVRAADLPRTQIDQRELATLAQDCLALLDRHVPVARLADGATADEELKLHLWRMARELPAFYAAHQIRPDLLRDSSLRSQLIRLARDTAYRIAECRIAEDLPLAGATLPTEHHEALEGKILHDGMMVYEAFLRIGEETLAERMAAWLLAYRQNADMYTRLAAAAGRARKPTLERRLREQAQRLSRA